MLNTNVGLCAIVFVALVFLTNGTPLNHGHEHLVGAKECTWGPSYWCGNLSNAKNCNAVRHCIQTVWEKQSVPVDNDSVCQICKDMVAQARDQLRSNETMEELKEVFEGSCNLIPIKLVNKECCKLVDDFIPELVEALSSQMNPDQVCSVAGLCNNAKIDKLLMSSYRGALDGTLEEENKKTYMDKKECNQCNRPATKFMKIFDASKPDDIKKTMIRLCNQLPSFGDCSTIVVTHFNKIFDYLKTYLNKRSLCILYGCYGNYQDQNAEEDLDATNELVDFTDNADKTCNFCVDNYIKNVIRTLVTNNSKDEFKMLLEDAFCHESRTDCWDIVNQYYGGIYDDFSNLEKSNLEKKEVCSEIGLCTKTSSKQTLTFEGDMPIMPEESRKEAVNVQRNGCDDCRKYGKEVVEKFKQTNPEDIKDRLLHWCGEFSSFSVGCSNIVATYFNIFYDHVNKNLDSYGLCHLTGYCVVTYHNHPENEESAEDTGLSDILMKNNKDDIPCELCQQLVQHLRDVLIANTTEEEFKIVLDGICNQTKGFRQECLSIVDQYYDEIYKSLTNNLDSNGMCILIGVCPKTSSKHAVIFDEGIMPMLPIFPPVEIKVTIRKKLGANEPKFTQEELKPMQIPIDHLMGAANPNLLVENGQMCTICEYVLHFIQETLATPSTEDEIKQTVENICKKFPNSIRAECHNFIDMYGDACIALLIQGLSPRTVCPKMQLCPSNDDVEFLDPKHTLMSSKNPLFKSETYSDVFDKPTCPLCLFAVEQAQIKIRDDKSKKHIKNVLDHLCVHLPLKLQAECIDFVDTYSNELIDMLITDFKPEEICVAIKLCTNEEDSLEELGISLGDDDSSSSEESINEIGDSNELPTKIVLTQDQSAVAPNCWLCEEIVKTVEKKMGKNKSKAEIEEALQHSCDKLRKSLQKKCHSYIDKYGDKIADLILKEMEPIMICRELGLCLWSEKEDLEIDEALKYDVIAMPNESLTDLSAKSLKEPPTCVLCEFVMTKLEAELNNKTDQDEIKRAVESICNKLPKTVAQSCDKFVEEYADAIIALISSVPPKEVCQKLQLCFAGLDKVVNAEVIECGICHGASLSLLPFFRQRTDAYEIGQHDMVSVGCEQLPAKYYQTCSEMIEIYGQSILHLSQKSYMDEAHICAEIGKCFDNEKSGLAFARITA